MILHDDPLCTLYLGDCVEVMAELPAESVDAIVTDPPYGIRFMGKAWDGADIEREIASLERRGPSRSQAASGRVRAKSGPAEAAGSYDQSLTGHHAFQSWCTEWAREAFRVAKPGAHLLAFGGTRTYHRLASAIEDAGWEIRDCLVWAYASGFPKSLDVSKAIDKAQGNKTADLGAFIRIHREQRGLSRQQAAAELFGKESGAFWNWEEGLPQGKHPGPDPALWSRIKSVIGAPDSDWDRLMAAAERDVTGRGKAGLTAGTIANFAGSAEFDLTAPATPDAEKWNGWGTALKPAWEPIVMARKPLRGTVAANVLAHGTGALNIDATRIGHASESDAALHKANSEPWTKWERGGSILEEAKGMNTPGRIAPMPDTSTGRWPANLLLTDEVLGEYSRFFTVPKSSRSDREPVLRGQLPEVVIDIAGQNTPEGREGRGVSPIVPARENAHPTVKPLDLMRHLVRLVTPPGGTVLDCFLGSGTTAIAANAEGFRCIGIEKEREYLDIALARMLHEPLGMAL